MKIADITTKAELDDAIETAMSMATGCLSDREIVVALRRAAIWIGEDEIEPSVAAAIDVADPAAYDTADKAEQVFKHLAAYGPAVMPQPRLLGLFEQKADEYEEETA